MNSRERVLSILDLKVPDRVPFVELTIDKYFIEQYLGINRGSIPESKYNFLDGPILSVTTVGNSKKEASILCDKLKLDAIGISFWIKHLGIIEKKGGQGLITGGKLKSVEDINSIQLPDPDDEKIYEPVKNFINDYRDMEKALYCVINLGSDPVILGMGFENFAMSIYTERDLVIELMELYADWYAKVANNLCELDLDFLWTTDDIAFKSSTYISPEDIKELLMPHYKKVSSNITKPWIYHSDGMLYDVLDDLITLDMNAIHPIEPESMKIKPLKEKYGERIAFCGHIDVDKLSTGTPGQIDTLVKQAIADGGKNGGYLCGSSNSITNYCKPENVDAMRDAILKYGKY